tara:strand:+ start:291 stop:488 length:198 start_codon:yes stop_codon:yes gene_type:complete
MKVGDLVRFNGTWGSSVIPGERQTGIVTEVWTNGRTHKQQGIDIIWDNGDFNKQFSVHNVEIVNE